MDFFGGTVEKQGSNLEKPATRCFYFNKKQNKP